ncbi:histidine kinase [Sphingobacterium sp. N143]|uniref:histidine kinase n=1 Tax=Sphingobacterium sp. N143 TaxID=2746727 RepID=UPI0025777AD4|nr:histidine kinase [Sphingobacterium sp. N143]MDM1295291.1 histidine kinase [Sphingobacterium sp. N143]
MNKLLQTNWFRHFCFWILYALYFFAVNALGNDRMSGTVATVTVFYCAIIFYVVSFVLKSFFSRGKLFMTLAVLGTFYVISGCVVYWLLYGSLGIKIVNGAYVVSGGSFRWGQFIQTLLVMHGNYTVIALVYYHYKGKLKELNEKLAAVEKQLEAESNMKASQYTTFSAQVHPHMMGNIFNHLKKEIAPKDPELGRQIGEIYRLMKFYMDAHDADGPNKILLSDEVAALQQYLSIQAQIEKDPFYIQLRCTGNLMRFGIAPTTLQTLAGNLFKHADIWDKQHPASIDVLVEHSGYMIRVKNRKRPGRQILPSHGVGLRNVRKRMEYLFAEDFTMSEMQDEQTYELTLCVENFKN